MPTIHHHAENGEYIGSSAAIESPLEPGVFLVPRNATEIAPPDAMDGFARVFNGLEWAQVLDKRGTVYWLSHDESHIITELGENIPRDASLEQPAAPEPESIKPPPPTPYSVWDEELLEWIEDAGLKAEWELQAEIAGLRTDLASTDWIIAKIGERQLMGDDIAPLLSKYADTIAQREAARARINELEAQTPEA